MKIITIIAPAIFFFILSSCTEQTVKPDDVEYRRDQNGTRLLYEIAAKKPYGSSTRAFVKDYFPNKQERFKISFLNGLKDGPFTFYYPDGKISLEGNYEKGLRDGKFVRYGQIGELVYEKNYKNGILDGNFSLYYKASKSDVYRYRQSIRNDEKIDIVKNHIRLRTKFTNGQPVGAYQSFDHPKGVSDLNESDLLNEEGFFDENGLLAEEQVKFYPKTKRLFVVLPGDDRIEFEASENGFSKAIDAARSQILAMPAFRNPERKPALVFTADEKGNLIAPIWTSQIEAIVLRDINGLNDIQEFAPNYEAFTNFALPQAIELDNNESSGEFAIIGTDLYGRKVDLLWSSKPSPGSIHLHDRILAKRTKTRRTWDQGSAVEADWFLDDGSQILLRGDDEISIGHIPSPSN